VGFVRCGFFGNLCTFITMFCIVSTVFFVLFILCIFISICFVCTSEKANYHRVTTHLQLVIIIKKIIS